MSVHDFYVLSPYLAMAGAAVFVILLDLVLPKKSLLPISPSRRWPARL